MRKCFLHAGIHKTGTTSIQHLLNNARDALQENGFYYPRSGLIEGYPGHHNLAWEMSNNPQFRRDHGGLAELLDEIRGRPETIILSSEDFSTALFQPAFREFRESLISIGVEMVLVLYFRDQLEWIPRIYLSLIETGWTAAWENSPSIWVDYGEILKRALLNGEVIVRSYENAKSVCTDFLFVVGLSLSSLNIDNDVRANRSQPLREYLFLFARNRLGRELTEEERAEIESLAPVAETTIQLSEGESRKVLERFGGTYRILSDKYGIPEPTIATRNGPCVDSLFVDSFFKPGSR